MDEPDGRGYPTHWITGSPDRPSLRTSIMSPKRRFLLTLLKLADLCVVVLAFIISVAATVIDPDNGVVSVLEIRLTVQNALFLGAYLLVWHFILRGFGLYDSYRLAPRFRELRDLSLAALVAVAPLVPLSVMFDFEYVSPSFLSSFASISLLALMIERVLVRIVARHLRGICPKSSYSVGSS